MCKRKPGKGQLRFTERLLYVVIDEAHLVTGWAAFRGGYPNLYRLRAFVPRTIPFLVPSATLRDSDITSVMESLRMLPDSTIKILRSNDRPDLRWGSRFMEHPASSFRDLDFVLRREPGKPPDRFLVFFDTTDETVEAVLALRQLLPKEDHLKIRWFNSSMSDEYRAQCVKDFEDGKIWGMCTTDAYGIVRRTWMSSGSTFSQLPRVLTRQASSLWWR
jgi:superfamily II DNA helicase RecQ